VRPRLPGGPATAADLPDPHRQFVVELLSETCDVPPRRRPPFASSTSTAPVAGSSGEVVRNRLDLGGQRHRNEVMDIAAGVQAPR
jgi:hypothetical protein